MPHETAKGYAVIEFTAEREDLRADPAERTRLAGRVTDLLAGFGVTVESVDVRFDRDALVPAGEPEMAPAEPDQAGDTGGPGYELTEAGRDALAAAGEVVAGETAGPVTTGELDQLRRNLGGPEGPAGQE